MIDFNVYAKAVIVTGDGDFYCLIDYLLKNNKLECILIPDRNFFSSLLKIKRFRSRLHYMNDLRGRLHKKEKAP